MNCAKLLYSETIANGRRRRIVRQRTSIQDLHHARSQRRRIDRGQRLGSQPYVLKNTGGVYSCTCPAWRNQSVAIERRTCKHLRSCAASRPSRTGSARPAGRGRKPPRTTATTAAARCCWPNLGKRCRPGRLVDERKARRRARLLGRQAIPLPAGQSSSTPPTGSSPACPTCRWTANCGWTARRFSEP